MARPSTRPIVVSVRGAAALCGLSVRTIRRLVRDGTLPPHYVEDGVLRVALADVDAYKQVRFYSTGTRRRDA